MFWPLLSHFSLQMPMTKLRDFVLHDEILVQCGLSPIQPASHFHSCPTQLAWSSEPKGMASCESQGCGCSPTPQHQSSYRKRHHLPLPLGPVDRGNESCQVFSSLKATLASSPVLLNPDFNQTFLVYMDASEMGLGAVVERETLVILVQSKN